ncbi:MAG TPA: HutD family protein [Micromonosporaceae bacterium]
MTLRHLPASDRAATAWRNGGGVTREVLAEPPGEQFAWRLSLADVDSDGPFSSFPGCGRIITVLRGSGMALTVDGVTHVLDRRFVPFPFDGGATTECRLLAGSVVDFNVIHRHDTPVTVDIHAEPVTLGPLPRAVVVALDNPVGVRAAGRHIDLAPLDALDLVDEASLQLMTGMVALIRVSGRTP